LNEPLAYSVAFHYCKNSKEKQIIEKALISNCIQSPSIHEDFIENYIILDKKLGKGTFGIVNLGIERKTGKKVAIKRQDKEMLKVEFSGIENLYEKEVQIHNSLHHKNIIQLLDVIETDKFVYEILEFANGGKLENLIEFDKLDEKIAKDYFLKICNAIEYLHKKKICHRDINTNNICLHNNDEIKIIDFGFADYFIDGNKKFDKFAGKFEYCPPEMILSQYYIGPEVDCWSLGICLFKMLTGYCPFRFSTNIINLQYSFTLEDEPISKEAIDLIKKILVKNVKERYTIEQIKNHPWLK